MIDKNKVVMYNENKKVEIKYQKSNKKVGLKPHYNDN